MRRQQSTAEGQTSQTQTRRDGTADPAGQTTPPDQDQTDRNTHLAEVKEKKNGPAPAGQRQYVTKDPDTTVHLNWQRK